MTNTYEYGHWLLVFVSSAVFIIFAFSFTRPKDWRDWRSFGAFEGFIVALFTEMYGFPLTLYLLSGWLGSRFPELDLFSHEAGHLWQTVFGIEGDAHFGMLHILSNLLIAGGFLVIARAWRILYRAQRAGQLATRGPYAYIGHPQYVGFMAILAGFLFQWPTLLTLLMFPVLVVMYWRLARLEDRDAVQQFGEVYEQYAAQTPAFIPRLAFSRFRRQREEGI